MGLVGIAGQLNGIEDRDTLGQERNCMAGALDVVNSAVGQASGAHEAPLDRAQ
ncbi:hypothetical protein BH10CHL1_BH10CHL1_32480 [soil metagenome]